MTAKGTLMNFGKPWANSSTHYIVVGIIRGMSNKKETQVNSNKETFRPLLCSENQRTQYAICHIDQLSGMVYYLRGLGLRG